MKVYIKPWEEALKSAKEFNERFVDVVDGMEYIIGISCRYGDWGHIVEAKKSNDDKFDNYTTYYNGMELDENYFEIAKERIDKATKMR